jgi:small ligand-binding sensory domain FIST
MKWASAVSVELPLDTALEQAVCAIRADLGNEPPDLAIVFVSQHYQSVYDRIVDFVDRRVGADILIGCSAGGVIGDGKEVEDAAALSLTAAKLPGVVLTPLRVENQVLPEADAPTTAWEELIHVPASERPHFLLFPDPFTFDAEALLRGLDAAFPGCTKVGGLASGGRQAGANALYVGHRMHRSGMVGLALTGNVEVDTIVAQGCRPIGEPMFVTRSDGNAICELDGQAPLEVLQELYQRSDARDRELFQDSLFVGLGMRALEEEYSHGDFLIRNIVGLDEKTGRLAVGAAMHDGVVVQFHLRDAKTSADDLRTMLAHYERGTRGMRPEGSLLFSCLGRGSALYGEPGHDSTEFRRQLGNVPLGGFFCNGEIGPVHGTTFLHGYTSSFGLFRSRS